MQKSAPILLIETATERSVIGFVDGDTLLFKRELPIGINNSKYLASSVHEGLRSLGITMRDLAAIGVGIGPGSYTGIRVGVALAKTLAYAADIPLVGICTLHSFVPSEEGPYAVMIDAKISGVYAIKASKLGESIQYHSAPDAIPLSQLNNLLTDIDLVVTPHAKVLSHKLGALYPQVKWLELPPDLMQMERQARQALAEGHIAIEGTLELMYLRKTQAELERLEKNRA